MLVDLAGSSTEPPDLPKAAAAPNTQLSEKQTFQAALVVRYHASVALFNYIAVPVLTHSVHLLFQCFDTYASVFLCSDSLQPLCF